MKLSFCIPTYNRCKFLKKNLDIIIRQIRELSVEKDVEILINDNASPDQTEELCQDYIKNNPDINIEFHRNEKNEGPDLNFIKAMHLAHGEYSILFGDDDFLIEGSLMKFFDLMDQKDISIFYSNRINVNAEGKVLGEQIFLDIPVESKVFDFSNEDSTRSFFYGVRTLGGIMTFISSVMYKTSILQKFPLKRSVIGSNYAFLYYWWSELLNGGKLCFINSSLVQATTSGATNNNYGKMVDRIMVDYVGIPQVINAVTNDDILKKYFYKVIDLDHPFINLQEAYIKDTKKFNLVLVPKLIEFGWKADDIKLIKYTASPRRMLIILYYRCLKSLLCQHKIFK